MTDCGMPKAEMIAYFRQLAERIDKGEEIKLALVVDAGGRAGTFTYGHKNVGEIFLQLEDAIFTQRLGFLLPQLIPQLWPQIGPSPMLMGATSGSSH